MCEGCGEKTLVPPNKAARRRFCSLRCMRSTFNRLYQQGPNNPRWRGGRALAYGPGWKQIREMARARDRVCRRCGKTPEQNGRALDVHHVDPFRFSGAHALEQLEALCRSCHMRADDHGRRDSARFLRAAGLAPRPTKREVRRLQALIRQAERVARRRELQARARILHLGGASLREIARALGVSHQTVANWLRGRHPAGDEATPSIAKEGALLYVRGEAALPGAAA